MQGNDRDLGHDGGSGLFGQAVGGHAVQEDVRAHVRSQDDHLSIPGISYFWRVCLGGTPSKSEECSPRQTLRMGTSRSKSGTSVNVKQQWIQDPVIDFKHAVEQGVSTHVRHQNHHLQKEVSGQRDFEVEPPSVSWHICFGCAPNMAAIADLSVFLEIIR